MFAGSTFWDFWIFPVIRKNKIQQIKITANIFAAKKLLKFKKYSLT